MTKDKIVGIRLRRLVAAAGMCAVAGVVAMASGPHLAGPPASLREPGAEQILTTIGSDAGSLPARLG